MQGETGPPAASLQWWQLVFGIAQGVIPVAMTRFADGPGTSLAIPLEAYKTQSRFRRPRRC